MRQFPFPHCEGIVQVNGLLVGRDQQVQNLLPLGGDDVPLAAEVDLQRHLHFVVLAQFEIHQQVLDPRQQVTLLVWLADEVVGAAFQATDDVLRVGQGGHQDDRDVLQVRVGLDGLAQAVAVQHRHHHVADDQGRLVLPDRRQGLLAIGCGHDRVAVLLEQVTQLLRLGRAVFGDDDFDVFGFVPLGSHQSRSS